MSEPAQREATYEDLFNIPENATGEILDGRLHVTPRPSRRHGRTTTVLAVKIVPPYDFGEGGGPGGWMFLIEPEIGFGKDLLVPDLAGWKRERFPFGEEQNWISVAPDWVCEVLSPSTGRKDKGLKMPVYARHGVGHIWLIDPLARTLDVYRLENGLWLLLQSNGEDDKVRAEPFGEVDIPLTHLWLDSQG